jgi:hypothetical protein
MGGVGDAGHQLQEQAVRHQGADQQPARQTPGRRDGLGVPELEPGQRTHDAGDDARSADGQLIAGEHACGRRTCGRDGHHQRRRHAPDATLQQTAQHEQTHRIHEQMARPAVEHLEGGKPPPFAERQGEAAEDRLGLERRPEELTDEGQHAEQGNDAGCARYHRVAQAVVEALHGLQAGLPVRKRRDPGQQGLAKAECGALVQEGAPRQHQEPRPGREAQGLASQAHVQDVAEGREALGSPQAPEAHDGMAEAGFVEGDLAAVAQCEPVPSGGTFRNHGSGE